MVLNCADRVRPLPARGESGQRGETASLNTTLLAPYRADGSDIWMQGPSEKHNNGS